MQPEFKRKYLKGLQKNKETTYEETVANVWHYVSSVGIFFHSNWPKSVSSDVFNNAGKNRPDQLDR